jgi:hypothetical protein
MIVPAGLTVSATNSGGGPTVVTLVSGTYTASEFLAMLIVQLNLQRPSGWAGSINTTISGNGYVTINCTGTWALAFTSSTVRQAIGVAADIASRSSAFVGTLCPKGLWMPDSPAVTDQVFTAAPVVTDLRTSQSGRGHVFGVVGNSYYQHRNLKWSHVPNARATIAANADGNTWEQWLHDTQFGRGFVWFAPSSKFVAFDHFGRQLGGAMASIPTWQIVDVLGVEMRRTSDSWDGLFSIEIPRLVAVIT